MTGVPVFDTFAERDARLPAPAPGATAVTLDDGALSVYYGSALGWRPPWNTAWGLVATAGPGVDVDIPDNARNNIEGADLTFGAVLRRRYEVRWEVWAEQTENIEIASIVCTLYGRVRCPNTGLDVRAQTLHRVQFGLSEDAGLVPLSLPVTNAYGPTFVGTQYDITGEVFLGGAPTVSIKAGEPWPTRVYVMDVGPVGPPVIE